MSRNAIRQARKQTRFEGKARLEALQSYGDTTRLGAMRQIISGENDKETASEYSSEAQAEKIRKAQEKRVRRSGV